MADRRDLPYTLRREPFGGIVYDPAFGTMLELDHDGYAVARRLLDGRGFFFDREQRAFAAELRRQLRYDRLRPVRLIDREPWATDIPVPTLSAPTLVDFQITTQCHMGCPHCYASAVRNGTHVSWEDLSLVAHQLHDCGVCQVAIGGGEPLLHPRLPDFLALCTDLGIVPNLTTGGNEFTPALLTAIRRHCGAIGMSLEGVGEHYDAWRRFGFANFQAAIRTAQDAGIPVVLQVTLSAANLDHLDEITAFCRSQTGLYGVIVLAYKQVGRGMLAADGLGALPPDRVSAALKRCFDTLSPVTRVGFDCCMTPGIAGVEEASAFADASNLEGCSATRGSVGISTDLEVIPCTFTGQYKLGNLRRTTLREIWEGLACERFREGIETKASTNTSCSGCGKRSACRGGCPVMPLINCHRDHLGAGGGIPPAPVPVRALPGSAPGPATNRR